MTHEVAIVSVGCPKRDTLVASRSFTDEHKGMGGNRAVGSPLASASNDPRVASRSFLLTDGVDVEQCCLSGGG